MRRKAAALSTRTLSILLGLILLGGCFTGERPSFTTEPFAPQSSSGDPSIDQVLQQLDATNEGPYTADYTVLTKFGNTTRPASVSVAADRRAVTVGAIRFVTAGGSSETCTVGTADPCSGTIDPARISDTQITPDFYAGDAAKRLRRSAVARIGPPVLHAEQIGGQTATCVDVPVPGGTSVYCTLPNGPLARLDDGAVTIALTQFAPAVDETLFTLTLQP